MPDFTKLAHYSQSDSKYVDFEMQRHNSWDGSDIAQEILGYIPSEAHGRNKANITAKLTRKGFELSESNVVDFSKAIMYDAQQVHDIDYGNDAQALKETRKGFLVNQVGRAAFVAGGSVGLPAMAGKLKEMWGKTLAEHAGMVALVTGVSFGIGVVLDTIKNGQKAGNVKDAIKETAKQYAAPFKSFKKMRREHAKKFEGEMSDVLAGKLDEKSQLFADNLVGVATQYINAKESDIRSQYHSDLFKENVRSLVTDFAQAQGWDVSQDHIKRVGTMPPDKRYYF